MHIPHLRSPLEVVSSQQSITDQTHFEDSRGNDMSM